jgi:hypothetical protein
LSNDAVVAHNTKSIITVLFLSTFLGLRCFLLLQKAAAGAAAPSAAFYCVAAYLRAEA